MKKYIRTLYPNIRQRHSARISISYFSLTRTKSPKIFDKLYIRVGGLVVSIRNLQGTTPTVMFRIISTALFLFPLYIRQKNLFERVLDSLIFSDMKKLNKHLKLLQTASHVCLMECLLFRIKNLSDIFPAGRLSIDFSPDLPTMMVLFYDGLQKYMDSCNRYYDSLPETSPLRKQLQEMYPNLFVGGVSITSGKVFE
jgi:hypothetical protein